MIYVAPEAVYPLSAREVPGGWTLFDARSVNVLRAATGAPLLSRAEALRLASTFTARPGETLPAGIPTEPDDAE